MKNISLYHCHTAEPDNNSVGDSLFTTINSRKNTTANSCLLVKSVVGMITFWYAYSSALVVSSEWPDIVSYFEVIALLLENQNRQQREKFKNEIDWMVEGYSVYDRNTTINQMVRRTFPHNPNFLINFSYATQYRDKPIR